MYDAVRTPFGRYGGALAGHVPTTSPRSWSGGRRPVPELDPAAGRRDRARQRQRRRRGQPQRRPDGRAAGRAADLGPRLDRQPAVRVEPRRRHHRLPPDRAGRGRRRRGRRRRVDEPGALGAAEAGAALPGRRRDPGLDHPWLAAGQPGDEQGVDGVARRGDRAAARARGRQPRATRTSSRCDRTSGGAGLGRAASTTTSSSPCPAST